MVNLETAVTDGTCPEPQNKPYIFDAPASAVTALKSATVSVATEANDHGMDCGAQGLSQNLTIASQASYPIIGIGNTAAQAFAPYRVTINGQRVAIITATQVIADNLVSTWTASSTQPGVASAIDPTQLVREVQQVRRTADTVIVYVHWGTETQACPNPQQEPLAQQLVKAGADIVIGSGTHVLLGAGYLGRRLRRLRPRQPRLLRRHRPRDRQRHARSSPRRAATSPARSGAPPPSSTACPNRCRAPRPPRRSRAGTPPAAAPTCRRRRRRRLATMRGETVPFVAPAAPPATTTTTTRHRAAAGTTTTTAPASGGSTDQHDGRTQRHHDEPTTSTTTPASTTTQPTDNAGG